MKAGRKSKRQNTKPGNAPTHVKLLISDIDIKKNDGEKETLFFSPSTSFSIQGNKTKR